MTVRQKLQSRTFWIAAFWTILVLIGIILDRTMGGGLPLSELTLMAGGICTVYVGGEKYVNSKKGQDQ